MSRSLNALAIIYRSDKRVGTRFVALYTRHLAARRRRVVRVLEIGIGGYDNPHVGGSSLRMWRTYFPRAQVIGVDIEPKVIDEPRIRFEQCDQSSRDDLRRIAALGPYDVIIDDGSHHQSHVLLSFSVLYPALSPGGVYVIEDLLTAYSTTYGGEPIGTEGTALSLARELVDEVNRAHAPDADTILDDARRGVAAIHAYSNIVFIERAGGPDPALNRA